MFGSVRLSVHVRLWDLRYAPLQWYRALLRTTNVSCAPWYTRGPTSTLFFTIFMFINEHANQGTKCSSVLKYTLLIAQHIFVIIRL